MRTGYRGALIQPQFCKSALFGGSAAMNVSKPSAVPQNHFWQSQCVLIVRCRAYHQQSSSCPSTSYIAVSVCTCCLVNEYQDCNAHLGVGICHSEVPCHTCDQLLGIQNFDPNKWGLENGLTTQNWGLESIGTMVDYGAPVSGGPSFSATNGVPIDPPILLGTENHPPSILWDHFVPICTILLSIFPRVYEYD